jgi:hypothetical protein
MNRETETYQTQLYNKEKTVMLHLKQALDNHYMSYRSNLISVQSINGYQIISAGNHAAIHCVQCDTSKLYIPDGNYTLDQAIPRTSNPVITLNRTTLSVSSAYDIMMDNINYMTRNPAKDSNANALHVDPALIVRVCKYLDKPTYIKFNGILSPIEISGTLGDTKYQSRNLIMPFYSQSNSISL